MKVSYPESRSLTKLGIIFFCSLGVRQGKCLSPLLFSLFLNDIEEQFMHAGLNSLEITMFNFLCYCMLKI